jgi:hypothetical protein
MPRRVLTLLALAFLLVAVPTAAQAKGATAANISGGGPGGLPRGPIDLKGGGEPGSGTKLANLAEEAGMWSVLFEGEAGGLDAAPVPAADRGPRYTITWTFPNGTGTDDKVRQWVWPYAAGGPVTYLAPGQPVMGSRTEGGWFRATDVLRRSLIALGLPKRPARTAKAQPAPTPAAPAPAAPAQVATPAPAANAEPSPSPALWPWVAAGVGLLAIVVAVAMARRRSPGGASAS